MSITRHRHPNVLAAQWSANGGALGTTDLTQPGSEIFGANVFSTAEQRKRLSKDVFKRLQQTLANGEPLDTSLADQVAVMRDGKVAQARVSTHADAPTCLTTMQLA